MALYYGRRPWTRYLDEWNLAFSCVYYFMFECFNNPLESTLVLYFRAILGRVCVFLFSKALALEHVPYLWTNVCISLEFQIYIYIYDVFSCTYIIV